MLQMTKKVTALLKGRKGKPPGKEKKMKEFKYVYIISSERAYRRNDEYRNELYSNEERKVGDTVVLDGLKWRVEEIKKGA